MCLRIPSNEPKPILQRTPARGRIGEIIIFKWCLRILVSFWLEVERWKWAGTSIPRLVPISNHNHKANDFGRS